MVFKFDIGDTVEVIYSPGVYHIVNDRYVDGLGRNIYVLDNGVSRAEEHLNLISKYSPPITKR